MNPNKKWLLKYLKGLVGRKIVEIGVSDDDFPTFTLDDGAVIEVSQDAEGNGPGFLFGLPNPK